MLSVILRAIRAIVIARPSIITRSILSIIARVILITLYFLEVIISGFITNYSTIN
jgi:hypothetical protein